MFEVQNMYHLNGILQLQDKEGSNEVMLKKRNGDEE